MGHLLLIVCPLVFLVGVGAGMALVFSATEWEDTGR